MNKIKKKRIKRLRKKKRVRKKISGTPERPRLVVYRSIKHIYAQVIDDTKGHTLVQASTLERALMDELKNKTKKEKARIVGRVIGKRCIENKIEKVVFDRNGYLYHGRVKEVAEGARESGLKF